MPSSRASVVASLLALSSLAALAALTAGCSADLSKISTTRLMSAQIAAPAVQPMVAPVQRAGSAQPAQAQPAQAQPIPAPALPPGSTPTFEGGGGENTLTIVAEGSRAPRVDPNAPVLATSHLKHSKLRTVSDDQLPKWVPVKGRLTVVDSHDLAENLGLVPKGTSKNSDERISVADKLEAEGAARAAARGTDPMTQGTFWSYAKAGKFRSRR